jgi:hypothetical protein
MEVSLLQDAVVGALADQFAGERFDLLNIGGAVRQRRQAVRAVTASGRGIAARRAALCLNAPIGKARPQSGLEKSKMCDIFFNRSQPLLPAFYFSVRILQHFGSIF